MLNVEYHPSNLYDWYDMNLFKFVGVIVILGIFFQVCVIFERLNQWYSNILKHAGNCT